MRAEVLERLSAIARGEIVPVPPGTPGTAGTSRVFASQPPGSSKPVPPLKGPLFHVFQAFQVEHDEIALAERAAIAIELGRVPPAYADAWAAFQTQQPGHVSEARWFRAVNDAGRFLDEWSNLALDFGWRPDDIFGPDGLAWFCGGEQVRALGPDNAITASGRTYTHRRMRRPD